MSSGLAPPIPQPSGPLAPRPADAEKYIDLRLEETRRHVRAVDLTVVSLKLCIGVLFYLLSAMVVDHWVLADGLGRGSRVLLWAVLVLVAGWYCARLLFPLLIHRINPIFAAQTIEHTRPGFKNGLINFLLLRREQEAVQADELSKRVYQGLQVRTASELSRVTVGTTVDRLHVIRLGYLLATLVAICCVYFVVSPKNPLVSFGRVILPWARIGAPTRVTIDAVDPGNTVAYQGDNLVVSAEVRGLRAGEPASLHYSSVDGQSVDQSVPMSVPEGGFRYQGELPPGNLGFQQSLLYWIAAGDASSPTFRIDVQIPPAIVVDRVEYDYPEYTRLPQRVAVREGDLRAIEGTRVTIHGSANYPVAQAFIELDGDSRPTVRMTADGSTATGRLTLAMSRSDPTQPEYHWYQLRFTDPERRENRRPIRHRIDVIPDQKPEVRFVDPPPEELQLPVNGSAELKVHAEDPDFGLRRVELRAEREGRGLLIPPLLKKLRPDKPHRGPFEAAHLFEPARLSLKAGDKVAYWAEAADCKEKADDPGFLGNIAETEKRTILIVAGDPQQKPSDKPRPGQGTPKKRQAGKEQGNPAEQPNEEPQEPGDPEQQRAEKPMDKQPGDKAAPPKARQPQDKPSPDRDQPGENQSQPDSGAENTAAQGEKPEQKPGRESGGKPGKKSEKKKEQSQPGDSGESSSDTEQPSGDDSQKADQEQASKPGGKKDPSGAIGEQPPSPVDGETNPAEAVQRILEHQEQQAKGQPGKQENQPKPDTQPSGQEPQEGRSPDKDKTQDSGNQPSQGEKKPAGKTNKSDTEQPASSQEPSPEEKSGQKPGGKQQKGDTRKGDQSQKPSAGADAKDADAQDAEAKAEDAKGADAKAKPGQKGNSGQTKSSDSQDMEQEGGDSQKGDTGPKGAASAKKKSSSTQKSSEQSAEPGEDGEKTPAKSENGKQEKKSAAGKRSKPSEGTEAAKDSEASEDSGDSGSKKGQPDARKAASKGQKGKAETEESQTDSQAKSGEKSTPGEKKGEQGKQTPRGDQEGKQEQSTDAKPSGASKPSERPDDKGKSPESMAGADEKKTRENDDQQKGPKGAEPQMRPESPGAGEPSSEKSSLPSPQEANQPRDKKPGEPDASKPDEKKGGETEPSSPSISPKTSNNKSDTEGDRSADGKAGGGQQAKQSGEGMAGSQTPADQGNQGSEQKGEGETGTKAGEQTKSDRATGKSGDQGAGMGSGTEKRPGGAEAGKQPQQGDPSQKSTDAAKGGQPGAESSPGENPSQKGGSTSGNPTQGGQPGDAASTTPPPPPPPPAPDDPNLDYARKQTTLALEHLADQLAKDKSELLERLGWDRAYAESFLRQWEQMRKAAGQPGPQGDAAKRELDKALKSLGLRPSKTQIQKGKSPTDKVQQLQDAGRFPPPLEWMDYYKAYNQGVAGSRD